jgi:tRNA-Thr(GGU) m(6)t(6)A37 methyltransferase TsaA
MNLEHMLKDLAGFSHIWLLFHFHQAENWKPLVTPPRTPGGRKVGVLASRSPHRPNPIGLTCVELLSVESVALRVRGVDLLDGSPVLDVKPYLSYCDSVSESASGWTAEQTGDTYQVTFLPEVEERARWIYDHCALHLLNVARFQLGYEPENASRKRVREHDGMWVFACRTWRMMFTLNQNDGRLTVCRLYSGYSDDDLDEGAEDPYSDKDLHRAFRKQFED